MLVSAILAAAVIAQGAYIGKTRKQMDALADQVQQLAAEAAAEPDPGTIPDRPSRRTFTRPAAAPAGSRLPPPRFAPAPLPAPSLPAPGALPLPPGLDNPEAREQLRAFVASELQRERDEQRDQMRQRFEEDQQRRLEATIKTLGLTPDEGKRLTEAVTAAQTARRDLRDKIQSGEISRTDIGSQLSALREKTDQQIKDVLGDDKMKKFQELQRQDRGWGQGGPGGPGRGGRGPGGPGAGQGGP
jgi:hypothetical protein